MGAEQSKAQQPGTDRDASTAPAASRAKLARSKSSRSTVYRDAAKKQRLGDLLEQARPDHDHWEHREPRQSRIDQHASLPVPEVIKARRHRGLNSGAYSAGDAAAVVVEVSALRDPLAGDAERQSSATARLAEVPHADTMRLIKRRSLLYAQQPGSKTRHDRHAKSHRSLTALHELAGEGKNEDDNAQNNGKFPEAKNSVHCLAGRQVGVNAAAHTVTIARAATVHGLVDTFAGYEERRRGRQLRVVNAASPRLPSSGGEFSYKDGDVAHDGHESASATSRREFEPHDAEEEAVLDTATMKSFRLFRKGANAASATPDKAGVENVKKVVAVEVPAPAPDQAEADVEALEIKEAPAETQVRQPDPPSQRPQKAPVAVRPTIDVVQRKPRRAGKDAEHSPHLAPHSARSFSSDGWSTSQLQISLCKSRTPEEIFASRSPSTRSLQSLDKPLGSARTPASSVPSPCINGFTSPARSTHSAASRNSSTDSSAGSRRWDGRRASSSVKPDGFWEPFEPLYPGSQTSKVKYPRQSPRLRPEDNFGVQINVARPVGVFHSRSGDLREIDFRVRPKGPRPVSESDDAQTKRGYSVTLEDADRYVAERARLLAEREQLRAEKAKVDAEILAQLSASQRNSGARSVSAPSRSAEQGTSKQHEALQLLALAQGVSSGESSPAFSLPSPSARRPYKLDGDAFANIPRSVPVHVNVTSSPRRRATPMPRDLTPASPSPPSSTQSSPRQPSAERPSMQRSPSSTERALATLAEDGPETFVESLGFRAATPRLTA